MARNTFKNSMAAGRYMFQNRFGPMGSNAGLVDHDYDNNSALTWSDAGDLNSLEALRVDADGRIQVDRAAVLGQKQCMVFPLVANAALGTQFIFIADRAMIITNITEIHATLGTDGAAVSMQVSHETGTQAPGTGTVVQTNSFNLKGTINTTQTAALLAVDAFGNPVAGLRLAAGDRLSVVFTGVLTSVAGVLVTVTATPGAKEQPAVYMMNANASIATQEFFSANRGLQIVGIQAIWATPGNDAGAVTIDIRKDTGTQAPAAGTTLLAAPLSVKTTGNTVAAPALTATAASLLMNAGDRLSIVTSGVLTSLAGLVVVVYFAPYYNRVEFTYAMQANANIATTCIFQADRDYEFLEGSEVHGVAGNDAGAVTMDIFIDRGTSAPGAGLTCTAGTANLKGTAETTQFFAPATALHSRMLYAGDRLTAKTTGVLTNLAGVTVTVSLAPR